MVYKVLTIIFVCSMMGFAQNLPEFKVIAVKISGKNKNREDKMKQSLKIFEKVMNDKSFQTELQTLKFYFDVEDDPYRNLPNRQIAEKIYAAKEHYDSAENNTADIYWLAKKRNPFVSVFAGCSVLGYGEEEESEIFTYTCFLDDNDLSEITGHIAHEWTHKLGFTHEFDRSEERDKTVPYLFGYLVREHSKKYF